MSKTKPKAILQRSPYPSPKQTGGVLLRRIARLMDQFDLERPLKNSTSHILFAVSGGPDSMALLHLFSKYGRRLISGHDSIKVLHVNHGWRGKASDQDQKRVTQYCKKNGLNLEVHKFKLDPSETKGLSLEDHARRIRKKIFQKHIDEGALILTAHHQGDLAETLLWRFLTGTYKTHGYGIWFYQKNYLRPFLSTQKSEILRFLKEENLDFGVDHTNLDTAFMRAWLRIQVEPLLSQRFPKWVQRISQEAIENQISAARKNQSGTCHCQKKHHSIECSSNERFSIAEVIQSLDGVRLSREHYQAFVRAQQNISQKKSPRGEICLGNGWKLIKN